jgi:hypothetical protein
MDAPRRPAGAGAGCCAPAPVVPIEPVEVRGADAASFSAAIFLEQLVWQVGYPLTVPLAYAIRGAAAVENMRFNLWGGAGGDTGAHLTASIFQLHLAGLWLGGLVAWAVTPPPPPGAGAADMALAESMTVEVATVSVAAVFQRVAVATKYAFLPPREYAGLMARPCPYARLAADQLIVGWGDVSAAVLDRELRDAAARTGIDATGVAFDVTREEAAAVRAILRTSELEAAEAAATAQAAAVAAGGSGGGGGGGSGSGGRRNGRGPKRGSGPVTAHPSAALLASVAVTGGSAPGLAAPMSPLGRPSDGPGPGGAGTAIRTVSNPLTRPAPGGGDGAAGVDAWHGVRDSTADGGGFSAYWLARAILRHACADALPLSGRINLALLVASVVLGALPAVVRTICGLPAFGVGPAQGVVFGTSLYLNIWLPLIVFSYMRVGLVDYRRRATALTTLGALASRRYEAQGQGPHAGGGSGGGGGGGGGVALHRAPSMFFQDLFDADGADDPTAGGGEHALVLRLRPPPLRLDAPGNAVAWLATRRILSAFGARYFRRIQAYASQALILAAGITAALLVTVAVRPPARPDASPAEAAPVLSFAAIAIWDLALIAALLLGALLYGATANETGQAHAALLAARELEVAQRAAAAVAAAAAAGACEETAAGNGGDPRAPHGAETAAALDAALSPPSVSELTQTAGVLSRVSRVLSFHAMLAPVTILGVPATRAVAQTVGALAVSGISVGLQLLRST